MDSINTLRHNVTLKDRKTLELSGVKNIESFDPGEFLIETALGYLNITGNELSLCRYDQDRSEVTIKGNIVSLSYVSNKKTNTVNKDKFLGKLLK